MREIKLEETIREDIKTWESLKDNGFINYMSLVASKGVEFSDMYQLVLNGKELWYGSLQEINAVVKTMIYQLERDYEV